MSHEQRKTVTVVVGDLAGRRGRWALALHPRTGHLGRAAGVRRVLDAAAA